MQKGSDLTYIGFIALLVVAVLVVLACYFLIGAVVGTIVLLVAVVSGIVSLARFIRRNDTA
jgi:hypothetical protein